MSLGRLMSVLSGVVLITGVALAQPAPTPPAGGTTPPAGGTAPAPGAGSAVQPIEDTPPSDMEGRDENPDAPKGTIDEPTTPTPEVKPVEKAGYPIEEAKRPITLPENMGEVSIGPHFQVSKFMFTDALRFRYGISGKIQLGLTYVWGAFYDDPATTGSSKVGFHAGKAAGLDVTYLLTNWLGVKVGVPVYLDPLAVSFAAGAPMKFIFDKFALGALDDVLNIRISKFPPSFYNEQFNAVGANNDVNGTVQNQVALRIAGYAVYQHKENMAFIGRVGVDRDFPEGGGGAAGVGAANETRTFIRAGIQITPKKFLDLGLSAGFDDLAKSGSFGLAGFLAIRI